MTEEIQRYLNQIHRIFKKYKLTDIYNEDNFLLKFQKHTNHLRDKYNKNGEMDFLEDDLLRLVFETRFAIANVILYFEEGLTQFKTVKAANGPMGTFFPSEIDMRFFYFVDDVFMRFYNAWNRVANFLNIFWINKKPDEVYFAPFMDELGKYVKHGPDYQSLKKFKETDYQTILNKNRRKIVHRISTSGQYFIDFIKHHTELSELMRKQSERDQLPHFFIQQYNRLLTGIEEMLGLIKNNVK